MMHYVVPSVGCVVRYVPTDKYVVNRDMADREWILWNKKGNTAVLVENYFMCGCRNQIVGAYSDCEFMQATYTMRNW
jgi:hypothetical protein